MVELELRQSTSMNAKILGSGEKSLVLAHGFGLDQSVWDQILPRFVEKCRVLVFDWSFSGAVMNSSLFDSQKYSSYEAFSQDLIALMDELSLRNSIFVGHSMAGMVGCIAAVKRPELFHRLVLLAASPRYLNSQDYQGGFDKSEIESMFAHIESDFQSWASKFAPLVAGVNDPTVVERVRSNLLRMKPGTALSMVKTIFLSDHRDVLKRVEVPSTIIQTQNDLAAPLAVAQFMQRNLKGKVALEVLPVEGHLPQITAPKLLIGVLDEVYLNSQDYQGGFDKSEIESMFAHIESDFQSWASKFAPLVAGVNDPTVVERVRSNLLRMKPGTALSMVKTIFLSDHRDVLKRVEVPSTIIQTQNDLAAPLAVAQFMQRNLKGKVALEVLPVEGHLPQITAPKLLIGVLDEVLDFDSDEPVK